MFENRRKTILYILCILGMILFAINNFSTDALMFCAFELASILGIHLLSRCAQDVKAEITILIFLAITLSSTRDAAFQIWQTMPVFIIYTILYFTLGGIFLPLLTIGASILLFPSVLWLAPVLLVAMFVQSDAKRIVVALVALTCPILYYILFRELLFHDSMETIRAFITKAVHLSAPFANMHPITYLLLLVSIIPAVRMRKMHNYLRESSMHKMQQATIMSFVSVVILFFAFNSGAGGGPLGFYIAIPAALTSGILFSSERNRRTDSLFYIFAMILLLNTLTNYFSL